MYGDFELLDDKTESVFAYRRSGGGEAFVTVLNFTGKEVHWEVPANADVERWVAGNYTKDAPDTPTSGKVVLRPWEGLLGNSKPISERRVRANL